MIENDNQLNITKAWLERFKEAKAILEAAQPNMTTYPESFVNKVQIDAVQSIIDELDHQVYEYENKEAP